MLNDSNLKRIRRENQNKWLCNIMHESSMRNLQSMVCSEELRAKLVTTLYTYGN